MGFFNDKQVEAFETGRIGPDKGSSFFTSPKLHLLLREK